MRACKSLLNERTANDDILNPPHNHTIPLRINNTLITRMHPKHPLLIPPHRLIRLRFVLPVPRLQRKPRRAQFPRGAALDYIPLAIHNLRHGVRQHAPQRPQFALFRVVDGRHERHGRGLRHPVVNQQSSNTHILLEPLEQGSRDRGPRRDARAEGGEAARTFPVFFEFGDEHGGYAVEGGAGLGFDAVEDCDGVELVGGEDDGAAVG